MADASITGTAVLQCKDPPPSRPPHHTGAWNALAYDARGWPCFEEATSLSVEVHLAAAQRQAATRGAPMPERFASLNAPFSRPKVTDISGGKAVRREVHEPPEVFLAQQVSKLHRARFTNGADTELVARLLSEFFALIGRAIATARESAETKE